MSQKSKVAKVVRNEMVGMFTLAVVWNNGDPVGKTLQIHMSVHGQWPNGITGQKLLVDALEKSAAATQKRLNDAMVKVADNKPEVPKLLN